MSIKEQYKMFKAGLLNREEMYQVAVMENMRDDNNDWLFHCGKLYRNGQEVVVRVYQPTTIEAQRAALPLIEVKELDLTYCGYTGGYIRL